MGKGQSLDPETWVDEYGDYLFRYALLRLRDPSLAEDMVQETFLAGLGARHTFEGRSSERVWLVGILKRKIVDHFRRVSREQPLSRGGSSENVTEDFFDARGKWKIEPTKWTADPKAIFEQREFREVFLRCLSELPPRHSGAFVLREMEELDSGEVCKVLNVSATNLWVMLHRARARLRRCLEVNWFGRKSEGDG